MVNFGKYTHTRFAKEKHPGFFKPGIKTDPDLLMCCKPLVFVRKKNKNKEVWIGQPNLLSWNHWKFDST